MYIIEVSTRQRRCRLMDIKNVKPPQQFNYFNHKIIINKHYEFTCDNRIFFSNTKFKDLKNHHYTFKIEVLSPINELGLATDFHEIDKIYNTHIAVKLNNCLINETLPDMNTTAENIAYWISEQFNAHLPETDELVKVTLYETATQGVTILK